MRTKLKSRVHAELAKRDIDIVNSLSKGNRAVLKSLGIDGVDKKYGRNDTHFGKTDKKYDKLHLGIYTYTLESRFSFKKKKLSGTQ